MVMLSTGKTRVDDGFLLANPHIQYSCRKFKNRLILVKELFDQ